MMLEISSTDPPPEKRAKTSLFMRYFVEREKKGSPGGLLGLCNTALNNLDLVLLFNSEVIITYFNLLPLNI